MASPGLSEYVTASFANRSKKVGDNVTKNTFLLNRLEQKGKVMKIDGGRAIEEPIEYAENGTFLWYGSYQPLNIQPTDVFTMATFDWKQAAAAITISGLEQIQNDGKNKFIDLWTKRMGNAEKTMRNQVYTGLFSDGTGFGGKQIGGLDLIVSTNPTTGKVGGIDRAIWPFWRNQAINSGTDPLGAITSANVTKYFNKMTINLTRGTDSIDMISAGSTVFGAYQESLQAIQRITGNGDSKAGAGFTSLKYWGSGQDCDVVLDGGVGGGCPSGRAYFLNTDYLYFKAYRDRYFAPIGDERSPVNQDAIVKLLGFAGNLTTSNPSQQGVLF